jgi:hypothetical protein
VVFIFLLAKRAETGPSHGLTRKRHDESACCLEFQQLKGDMTLYDSRYNENDLKRPVREADTQLYSVGILDPFDYRAAERLRNSMAPLCSVK